MRHTSAEFEQCRLSYSEVIAKNGIARIIVYNQGQDLRGTTLPDNIDCTLRRGREAQAFERQSTLSSISCVFLHPCGTLNAIASPSAGRNHVQRVNALPLSPGFVWPSQATDEDLLYSGDASATLLYEICGIIDCTYFFRS